MFGFGEILVLTAVAIYFVYRRRIREVPGMFAKSLAAFRNALDSAKDPERPVKDVRRLK